MSRAQQASIRSFFQPRPQPEFAAPPSSAPPRNPNDSIDATKSKPPPAPPLPPTVESQRHASSPAASSNLAIPINLPPSGIPVLPSPPSLPSGATIVPLAEQHIPALRRINSLLLPVAYPDAFYAKALDPLVSGLFSRAILWQDPDADAPKVIGGLICRLEPNPFLDAHGQPLPSAPPPSHQQKPVDAVPYHAIYIQSLALLSPYRSLGLAAAALEHVIASAALLPAAGSSIDARTVYAHVWTENEEGLRWYEARGFAREGREPVRGYYFKLRPDTAWVVRRDIGRRGGGGGGGSVQIPPSPAGDPPRKEHGTAASTGGGPVLAAAVNLPPIASPSASPAPADGIPSSRKPSASPSSSSTPSLSFQNMRPETEWNDLPPDMLGCGPGPGRSQRLTPHSGSGSGASSRSSSTARKKKERAYPSAAFGN
ncbi:hypothetical protein VTK56DRAFT_2958 [Thermocarpiscus australiensis]